MTLYKIEKLVTRFQQPPIWVRNSVIDMTRNAAQENLRWLRHQYPDITFRLNKVD